MARFQTVVRQARFSLNPFTPDQMVRIAQRLSGSVVDRISHGLTVDDSPARELSRGYLKAKQRYAAGVDPVRNWIYTGRTLRSLKVLTATQNRAVIGFSDAVAASRAFFNNRRQRQFGVSPRDRQALVEAVNAVAREGLVDTRKTA